MASINLIKASDGTGNASTATVQTVRNSGVTTIIVDTVNNIPATFMGSMGTPHTFVDPVTSEEITVISEATAVDFTGHVSGANLEIDSIAPGYTDLGSAVGDIIVIRPTTAWANNIATVLAVAHSDTGAITNASVTTAKQTATSFYNIMSDVTPVTTSLQNAATVTLPTVSAAHKYLINAIFQFTTDANISTYTAAIYEGANPQRTMLLTATGAAYWAAIPISMVFTSSATGGQTINFKVSRGGTNGGELYGAYSHYTIVDLGCA